MKLFPNSKQPRRHQLNRSISLLLLFCFSLVPLNIYAAANINNCKSKWVLTNITPGMQFGDFIIESGTGTITLNGGTARSAGGTVGFVNAGSAVNSHKISINNTRDPTCGTFGISLVWNVDPTATPMTGPGGNITMSNVLVDIPGEPGTPFTLPYTFSPATLPFVIEITSQMNTAFPQVNGTYSSAPYDIGVLQSGTNTSGTGVADTVSITPLTLTAGVAMDFGQVSSGSAGGSIILNEISGARSVASGNADVVSDTASGVPGTFTIQGDAGLSFSVSYINGTLTDTTGGNAMTISGFTDTTAALTLTGGADTFSVGATLNLNAEQPAGNYSTANPGGSPYSVTVNYD